LAGSGGKMATGELDRILSSPLSANPLFLRILLQELLAIGIHDQLPSQIQDYLKSESVDDLYLKVFQRWEKDFGPSVVRTALAIIAVCTYEISEHDLRGIVGLDDSPLDSARWSPFFLTAELDLSPRPGVLALTNEYISRAIEHTYLSGKETRSAREKVIQLYTTIATTSIGFSYVGGVENRIPSLKDTVEKTARQFSSMQKRAFQELPAQLFLLGQWDALAEAISSGEYLDWAFEHVPDDVRKYWCHVLHHRPSASRTLCCDIGVSTSRKLQRYSRIAVLLVSIGKPHDATKVLDALDEAYPAREDWSSLGYSLLRRAKVLRNWGDFTETIGVLRHAAEVFLRGNNEVGYACALNDLGAAVGLKDRRTAKKSFEPAIRIFQKTDQTALLAFAYSGLGCVLSSMGQTAKGLEYLQRSEVIFRQIGDLKELANTLSNEASALLLAGRLLDAKQKRCEAEEISKHTSDYPGFIGIGSSVGNRAKSVSGWLSRLLNWPSKKV
jgi:tetratricopeptide (TPR) repeat protein